MIKKTVSLGLAVLFVLSIGITISPKAGAAFNPSSIMNDAVFDNAGSMSANDIQNFLNQFPSSCLRNYSAPYPNNYFSYGGNVSAATVIRRVADLWALNPQVILATLQKESSVVTGTATYGCKYINTSMGFNCPDSGGCPVDPANAGFSQQVTKGSWLLKAGKERSLGNINWDPPLDPDDDRNYYYSGPMTQGNRQRRYDAPMQYFDGIQIIDKQAVSMGTGSTASFYFYTPHFSGNQHFVALFEGWFGSTQTIIPYAWSHVSQSAYSDVGRTQTFNAKITTTPGTTIYMRIKALNIGNQTWTPSNIRLGTSKPNDRASVFKNSDWASSIRPTQLLEASVPPNQTGTFEFSMTAPLVPGSYKEYFNIVAEGISWFNDPGQYFAINVVPEVSPTNSLRTGLASGASINLRDYLLSPDTQSTFVMQSDGNLVLYGNFNPLWSSDTAGQAAKNLIMQTDGNLVIYSASNQALWNSGTHGNPGARLELQTDGNLVIYSQTGTPLWSTSTVQNPNHLKYVNTDLHPSRQLLIGQSLDTADRKYKMILQKDGNLVLYSPIKALWSSGTVGSGANSLIMQSDGNLVLYNNSKAVWSSGSVGKGVSFLTVQPDGNLVIYNGIGQPTWASNTAGQ